MVRVDLPSNVVVRSGWDRMDVDIDVLEQGEVDGGIDFTDDFVGPVEIRSAGSKGRGLFTTQSVAAGQLLLKELAFATAARVSQITSNAHSPFPLLTPFTSLTRPRTPRPVPH